MAEDFDDDNGNGVWDPGEYFTDSDGDNQWDGPELIKKLMRKDGDYWLEPEMYEDFEPFMIMRASDLTGRMSLATLELQIILVSFRVFLIHTTTCQM